MNQYENENLGWTIATLFMVIIVGSLFALTVNEEHVARLVREREVQAWREQTRENRQLAAVTSTRVKEDDTSSIERKGDEKETIENPAPWVDP
jgi:hypothetical protein